MVVLLALGGIGLLYFSIGLLDLSIGLLDFSIGELDVYAFFNSDVRPSAEYLPADIGCFSSLLVANFV